MIYTTSYLAILIATVGSFMIGFLWYSKWLFGDMWLKLSGVTPAQIEEGKNKSMVKPISMSLVSGLVTTFAFFTIAESIGILDFAEAVKLAIVIWLGFSIVAMLNSVLWEGKTWKMFFINVSQLLASLIFSAIIYVWLVV